MKGFVIDTNVILAANGAHEELSIDCVAACAAQIQKIVADGTVFIDDDYRILGEYIKKTNHKKGKGVGDVFLKWLFQNCTNLRHCIQVPLNELAENQFEEFPKNFDQQLCDPSDRKFIAVANASSEKPRILQASDCKWLDWHANLRGCGLEVVFLCLNDVRQFYARKFPDRELPHQK